MDWISDFVLVRFGSKPKPKPGFSDSKPVQTGSNWFKLAQKHQLDAFDVNSLTNKKLHSEMIHRLRKLLYQFPAYAKIRRVTLTLEPWTLDNDLLTATLKVKRNMVIKHHQADIDKMYQ